MHTMRTQGETGRDRQEIGQVSRGMVDAYPKEMMALGWVKEAVKTIVENPTKPQEVSVLCSSLMTLSFNAKGKGVPEGDIYIRDGAIDAMLGAILLDSSKFISKEEAQRGAMTDEVFEMHYNVYRDCTLALGTVVW